MCGTEEDIWDPVYADSSQFEAKYYDPRTWSVPFVPEEFKKGWIWWIIKRGAWSMGFKYLRKYLMPVLQAQQKKMLDYKN